MKKNQLGPMLRWLVFLGLLAASLFTLMGAASSNWRVVFPSVIQSPGDTTQALCVNAAYTKGYTFDVGNSIRPYPAWFRACLTVSDAFADIDTCKIITYGTCDGVNYVSLDSQEVTGSTVGSSVTWACSTAVAGDVCAWSHLIVAAQVFGDDAGTGEAVATAFFTIWFYDASGNPIVRKTCFAPLRYVE